MKIWENAPPLFDLIGHFWKIATGRVKNLLSKPEASFEICLWLISLPQFSLHCFYINFEAITFSRFWPAKTFDSRPFGLKMVLVFSKINPEPVEPPV